MTGEHPSPAPPPVITPPRIGRPPADNPPPVTPAATATAVTPFVPPAPPTRKALGPTMVGRSGGRRTPAWAAVAPSPLEPAVDARWSFRSRFGAPGHKAPPERKWRNVLSSRRAMPSCTFRPPPNAITTPVRIAAAMSRNARRGSPAATCFSAATPITRSSIAGPANHIPGRRNGPSPQPMPTALAAATRTPRQTAPRS